MAQSSGVKPMLTHIPLRGAREHNVRNVDVDILREALTMISGLSDFSRRWRSNHQEVARAKR